MSALRSPRTAATNAASVSLVPQRRRRRAACAAPAGFSRAPHRRAARSREAACRRRATRSFMRPTSTRLASRSRVVETPIEPGIGTERTQRHPVVDFPDVGHAGTRIDRPMILLSKSGACARQKNWRPPFTRIAFCGRPSRRSRKAHRGRSPEIRETPMMIVAIHGCKWFAAGAAQESRVRSRSDATRGGAPTTGARSVSVINF